MLRLLMFKMIKQVTLNFSVFCYHASLSCYGHCRSRSFKFTVKVTHNLSPYDWCPFITASSTLDIVPLISRGCCLISSSVLLLSD